MATGDVHKKFVKISPAVPEICSCTKRQGQTHTDRHTHTDRQTDRNTPLPYQGRVIMGTKLVDSGAVPVCITPVQ